jgi:hypothetical protein
MFHELLISVSRAATRESWWTEGGSNPLTFFGLLDLTAATCPPVNQCDTALLPGGGVRVLGRAALGLVPLERLPQPELDFAAQRAHLPPRLGGQRLSQIILEADREASILVRVVSHGKSSSRLTPSRRRAGICASTRQPKMGIWLKLTGLPI